MTDQVTAPASPAAPTGPVARDPLNPNVVIPIYLGGDGPVAVTASTPEERGDTVGTSVAAPVAVTEPAASPVEGDPVAGVAAVTEPAVATSSEPAATTADPAVAPAEPAKRNDKGQFIPRARFNEVNEENKQLKQKLAAMEGGDKAVAAVAQGAYDFDAKETEHANLVLDGKIAEAVKLRGEIRAAERAQYLLDAQTTTIETTRQMSVKERITATTEQYETLPQMDPESDQYNDELLSDVRDIYAGALDSGRYADAAAAFEASIQKALKLHGIEVPTQEATPVVAAATPATPVVPARTAEKRVQAIVNQPPTLAKTGTSGAPDGPATIDVRALSDRDFNQLPEATKRRLRGDMI